MTTSRTAKPSTEADRIGQARQFVNRAIQEAVSPSDIVERPVFPGAATWSVYEPSPMAGFRAAQQVARLAEQQMHQYALALRGEGASWRELADLMEVPWSDDYARDERAFELVAGPDDGGPWSRGPTARWHCGGPLGCGRYIIDLGPYNGHPSDNEDGHAADCRRLAAEVEAHEKEWEERDRRNAVMDEAYARLPEHSFDRETADRARYVQAHGGRYLGWSTSESLAVGLVLNDPAALQRNGYPKRRDAISRVVGGMGSPPEDPEAWLALIRAAATGERS